MTACPKAKAGDDRPRSHDHADYHGAFVTGPDGHKVEAVCHAREP